jgi:hypothetical protein
VIARLLLTDDLLKENELGNARCSYGHAEHGERKRFVISPIEDTRYAVEQCKLTQQNDQIFVIEVLDMTGIYAESSWFNKILVIPLSFYDFQRLRGLWQAA